MHPLCGQDSGTNLGLFGIALHVDVPGSLRLQDALPFIPHPPAAANPATPWVVVRVARPAPRNPRAAVVRPMTNNKQRKRTSNIRPGNFRKLEWVGS